MCSAEMLETAHNWDFESLKTQLARFYVSRNALSRGEYRLTGGRQSDYYIDGRLVTTHPPALDVATQCIISVMREYEVLNVVTKIVVPVLSGVTLGTALSLKTRLDLVMDRGVQKTHGMGRRFEGSISKEDSAVIVDDLLTSGTTLLQTIDGLIEREVRHDTVIVLVDRLEGGRECLEARGLRLISIITVGDILRELESSLQ